MASDVLVKDTIAKATATSFEFASHLTVLTLLVVQLKIAVFVTPGDGIRYAITVWVFGMHNGY